MTSDPNPIDGHPPAAAATANPYAPTSHVTPENYGLSEVETYRRKYLNHEASVKAMGFLYLLFAGFMVLGGSTMMIGVIASAIRGDVEDTVIMGAFAGFYLLLGIAQGYSGYGLRKLKSYGRNGGIVFSILGLLLIPIGTLISAYFLYLLLSEKGRVVFSDEYRQVIAQTPHIKYKTSKVVWFLLGLVLLLVAVGLVFTIGVA